MNAGKFPRGIKFGRVYRWALSDIEEFEKEGRNL